MRPVIAVACGVLQRADGAVLIAQRPAGKIAAGKWEFPGGKIEAGESPLTALVRELREELGIEVQQARPLIRLTHDYSDRTVVLDTWLVQTWVGQPQSHEGQALAWCPVAGLSHYDLLAADGPIVKALRLPAHYAFTSPAADDAALARLDRLPERALLRLRWPGLSDEAYHARAARWIPAAQDSGLRVLLDRNETQARSLGADGVHAPAVQMQAPIREDDFLRIASVHDAAEVARAQALGYHAAVLGPVLPTPTHPDTRGLGWTGFTEVLRGAALPVYALGGVGPANLQKAFAAYAQGVAAIRAYGL